MARAGSRLPASLTILASGLAQAVDDVGLGFAVPLGERVDRGQDEGGETLCQSSDQSLSSTTSCNTATIWAPSPETLRVCRCPRHRRPPRT